MHSNIRSVHHQTKQPRFFFVKFFKKQTTQLEYQRSRNLLSCTNRSKFDLLNSTPQHLSPKSTVTVLINMNKDNQTIIYLQLYYRAIFPLRHNHFLNKYHNYICHSILQIGCSQQCFSTQQVIQYIL